MSDPNGSARKSCATCTRWLNPRPADPQKIGSPKIGDCDRMIFPVVLGVHPSQGVQQAIGGTYAVTTEAGYCSEGWRPKLAVLAGFSKPLAEDAPTTLAKP